MTIYLFSRERAENRKLISLFRDTFCFRPGDINLYKLAFRHKSLNHNTKNNNERLEFLGDSILGSVIAEYIFDQFPKAKEGFLSKMRSKIVNRESLNEIAFKMGFEEFVEYDKSGKLSRQTAPDIFGNAFEAFIGALYLDKGYKFSKKYIEDTIIAKYIDIQKVKDTEQNYKGRIFEYGQKHDQEISFVIEESMRGNDLVYVAKVMVGDEVLGIGEGPKKKKAEQEAAKNAFRKIRQYR